MSSAKSKSASFASSIQLIPASLRSITLRITLQSMAIANNNGDRMQPWQTPVVTWNQPLISLFILIALKQSVYRFCITSTSFFGSPYHSRIFHNASLLMLSNVLQKSTKFTNTGFWPSDTFYMICRREKIRSIQDHPGLKPACCWRNSWSTVFRIRFSNTVANTLTGTDKIYTLKCSTKSSVAILPTLPDIPFAAR